MGGETNGPRSDCDCYIDEHIAPLVAGHQCAGVPDNKPAVRCTYPACSCPHPTQRCEAIISGIRSERDQ